VINAGNREAPVSALWFGMLRNSVDVSAQYTVLSDYRNPHRIPAGSTVTFLFFADVSFSANSGTVNVTANLETFHPVMGVAQASTTQPISVISESWPFIRGPSVSINAPVAPQNRVCGGGNVAYTALVSSDVESATWRFSGGAPSTSSAGAPMVRYDQPGNYPYSLAVSDDDALVSSAVGTAPIFVGGAATTADSAYPTGSFVLESPATDAAIDMTDLPDDVISMNGSASTRLRQCDGTAVPAGGQRYVTLFVDRGQISPSVDARADLPGIQRLFDSSSGIFADLDLNNDPLGLEGTAMVYGEFFHPSLQLTTAAGYVSFRMTNDAVRPRVLDTWPIAECTGACIGKGQPWLFRFSEPVDPATLANITVQRLNGTACASAPAGSLAATRVYDPASRTLRITPASQVAASYTVRVSLGTAITDTSENGNALLATSRCAVLGAVAAEESATMPVVTGPVPAAFSPDGDGTDELTTLQVTPDAQTRWFELRIRRGSVAIWSHVGIVTSSEPVSVTWDGRDWSGRVVPNGFYRVDVIAYNADGAASPSYTGVIEVASAIHFIGVPRYY